MQDGYLEICCDFLVLRPVACVRTTACVARAIWQARHSICLALVRSGQSLKIHGASPPAQSWVFFCHLWVFSMHRYSWVSGDSWVRMFCSVHAPVHAHTHTHARLAQYIMARAHDSCGTCFTRAVDGCCAAAFHVVTRVSIFGPKAGPDD